MRVYNNYTRIRSRILQLYRCGEEFTSRDVAQRINSHGDRRLQVTLRAVSNVLKGMRMKGEVEKTGLLRWGRGSTLIVYRMIGMAEAAQSV